MSHYSRFEVVSKQIIIYFRVSCGFGNRIGFGLVIIQKLEYPGDVFITCQVLVTTEIDSQCFLYIGKCMISVAVAENHSRGKSASFLCVFER